MTATSLTVRIQRTPATVAQADTFDVPAHEHQTVLDVVSWVQQHADPTLTYRFACRVGMCGSCAMMVNGVPRWTCRTNVNKVLRDGALDIAPLRNFPVIKDLAVDMDPFFDKWTEAEGQHHGSRSRDEAIAPVDTFDPRIGRCAIRAVGVHW
ncbi:MAG: 2Fe-2S iron-sulfur cluster-binding protein, partial [Pseudomonadota bacterium]